MAIPRRAQAPIVPQPHSADRPLFLADLPHVGEKGVVLPTQPAHAAATNKSIQLAASTHPAFAEIVAPAGRVEKTTTRRERLEQRFVDEAHQEAKSLNDEFEPATPLSIRPQADSRTHQNGWRKVFSRAHSQLAPFAGLIVTLALLSSAGLLYWLISREQPTSFDQWDFQMNEGSFGVQMGESDLPASAIPYIESQNPSNNDTQESPKANQAQSPVEPTAKPGNETHSPAANATASMPLGALYFPTTNTPLELDWSKAFDNTSAQPLKDLHGLPEVAEREVPAAESPVAR